ncbi:MAG: hypothetical protein KatS3mg129_0315 [Leptospiraceae bacterium]|nr:MAG: hypothetical protein KatS3mg129_0315 [Leptospiraceae bacterium]
MKRLIIILLLIFIGFCQIEETIKDNEAYEDFLIAYLYKASQCKTQPSYFLLFPENVSKRWFNACLFSIIRSDCPFNEYPIICLKIYE